VMSAAVSKERVQGGFDYKNHIPAFAAIPAIWAAARHKFFPSKVDDTCTTTSGS